MKAQRLFTALSFLLIALTSPALYGQNITGSILGQVSDTSGSAIPGAAVTLRDTDTGAIAETTTDASGSYSVPNLLAGPYELAVHKAGFQTLTVTALRLLSAQTLRQDLRLEVGAVQQNVEVTAQALLIRTDSQTIGSTLGSRQVADLPLAGRTHRQSAGDGAGSLDYRR